MKACSKCGEPKEEDQFYYRKFKSKQYRCNVCYVCRNKAENTRNKSSLRSYLLNNMCGRRYLAKKRNVAFTVSLSYLKQLYDFQKGRCAYTGIKLDYKIHKRVSLDRWDNDKGYIEGNVLYCCSSANEIKSDQSLKELKKWMPSWFAAGHKIIKEFKYDNSILV